MLRRNNAVFVHLFFYSDTAFARFLETGERLHSFSETGKTPRESFLVNLSRCWRARFDFSHFSKLRCTITFSHHSSRQDAIGDRKVSDPLALSLSNEAIELVDANGLHARDAVGRAHSLANPRPRNRPVKNANARLRKYEF